MCKCSHCGGSGETKETYPEGYVGMPGIITGFPDGVTVVFWDHTPDTAFVHISNLTRDEYNAIADDPSDFILPEMKAFKFAKEMNSECI